MSSTAPSRARGAVLSLLTLGGGISLAAVPAATLSISSHTFSIADQGIVAVSVTVALFASQVTSAAIVEARLSSPGSVRRVALPRWLIALTLLAAVATALFPTTAVVVCVALPILLSGLETGRNVAVAERHDHRELFSALSVGIGALAGLAIAFLGMTWGLIPLVAGVAVATLVRARASTERATHADPTIRAWVVTDVGITGVIYPALNAAILAMLGPAASALFAVVSTVSGVLSIPINFMRVRLLKEHALSEIVVSVAALLAAIGVIAVAEFTGLFSLIFGPVWGLSATLLPLAVACVWRSASILSTLPFASLRRGGYVRLLTVLRGAVALLTLGAALLAVTTQQIALVFGVFAVGELLQALLFEIARRRVKRALPLVP